MTSVAAERPSVARLLSAVPLLLAAVIAFQVLRDRDANPMDSQPGALWIRSGEALKRMSLGYEPIVSDVYWMRAVVYYGGQRLATSAPPNYDLLYSLLDLVTTLDPRFNLAYRFGAIFLAEAYPSGPGRPDQAIALLQWEIGASCDFALRIPAYFPQKIQIVGHCALDGIGGK